MSPEHVDVALTRNAMEHFLNVYQEFVKVQHVLNSFSTFSGMKKYKSVLYLMLYQKLYFNFVDCFEWNEKTWKGTKPSSPVSTVCGLNTCTSCPSKFVMPDL